MNRSAIISALEAYRIQRGSGVSEPLRAVDVVGIADAIIAATDADMKTALKLLDRWDATRSEVSGKGTVETLTREFIAKMGGLPVPTGNYHHRP